MEHVFTEEDNMKNTAAKMIITVMSLLTIAAILAGLYIHVFRGNSPFRGGAVASDRVAFDEEAEEISIEADAARVTVEEGDRLSVEYCLPKSNKPIVELKEGRLSVAGGKTGPVFFLGGSKEFKVNVTVPAGTKLKSFSLRLDAGRVTIGSIDAEHFSIKSDAGDMKLAKLNTGDFEIRTDAGNIDIEELTADRAEIKLDAGNIEIRDSSIDTIEANADAGNIEVKASTVGRGSCETDFGNISLAGEIGDVSARTSAGNTSINGK